MVKEKLYEFEERNSENKKEIQNWELLVSLKEEEGKKAK